MRLVGAILQEVDDEWTDWQVERRYFSLDSMRKLVAPQPPLAVFPVAPRLAPVREPRAGSRAP